MTEICDYCEVLKDECQCEDDYIEGHGGESRC